MLLSSPEWRMYDLTKISEMIDDAPTAPEPVQPVSAKTR